MVRCAFKLGVAPFPTNWWLQDAARGRSNRPYPSGAGRVGRLAWWGGLLRWPALVDVSGQVSLAGWGASTCLSFTLGRTIPKLQFWVSESHLADLL